MYKLNITNEDINIDIEDTDRYIKYIEKLTNIQWRIIPDFEDYIISEYGDIINLKYKRILNLILSRNYYTIGLCKNTIYKTFRIHRLVYKTFIDQDIEDFDIHHKDENRINNHYSNLEKINHSDHKKYHRNLESEEYLKRYKEYYNLKYKDHLSTEEIAKRYNISIYTILSGIQKYKIYLFNNKDINKYNSSNTKEKQDFYSNIILKEDKRRYLEKAEEIYNRKNKEHLSNKQLAKIYNTLETNIKRYIKDIKYYIFLLNRDLDKFYKLSKKEKIQLRKDITEIERKKYLKEYLKKAEEIYNRKNKEHLTYKQLAKIYNVPESSIECYIKEIKIFIFLLDRDLDKFYKLTSKEKRKLRKKITTIDKWNNNILDIGKQIEDLKLSGLSTKDIANRLNISKNKILDIYKKYKKFKNYKETKDELKSIKKYN